MTPSILARLVDGFRAAVRREQLPEALAAPEAAHLTRAHPSLLRDLFAREPLPQDPEPPAPARARRGPASLLFGAEPLPVDAPLAPPPRHHWIHWLLLPERIDDR